jgi:hypothetical protein
MRCDSITSASPVRGLRPCRSRFFFDGEDPDAAQFHTLAALQGTGNLIQYRDNQAFGLGVSSEYRPFLVLSISLKTLATT